MTKPKNPYFPEGSEWFHWEDAYDAGLRDGERRLARALQRFLANEWLKSDFLEFYIIEEFLTARMNKGKNVRTTR